MTAPVSLRQVKPLDLATLQELCRRIYPLFFGDHWENQGLDMYLEEQFGTEKLSADLENKDIHYAFICIRDIIVGFSKLNFSKGLPTIDELDSCELEKMYLLPEYKRQGIGSSTINLLIEIARKRGQEILMLHVLDTNEKAISFYRKMGFRFHGKIRLDYPDFKEELKGLHRMYLELK